MLSQNKKKVLHSYTLFNFGANRLYQNRLRDKGVVDMLPGLYEAKALKLLRYIFATNAAELLVHMCN